MSQELIERKQQQAEEIAKRFETMAARIRLNGSDNFGGAFLLVPPLNAGTPVELLTLSDINAGNFWMTVKLFIDEQYKAMVDLSAQQRRF